MKKVFLAVLCAGLFFACGNKKAQEPEALMDTVPVEEVIEEVADRHRQRREGSHFHHRQQRQEEKIIFQLSSTKKVFFSEHLFCFKKKCTFVHFFLGL